MKNLNGLQDGGILGEVRRNGTYHALVYAGFTFCTGVILSLGIAFYGAMLNAPDAAFLSALVFVSFGMAAFLFGVFVLMGTGQKMGNAIKKGFDLLDAEIEGIKAKYELPQLPPAASLPAAETFTVTTGEESRAVVKEFVNGFDPRTLEWLAKYLARGGRMTEGTLEHMPLPYQEEISWGLKESTPLTRACDLCEARGIMSARDSERRKPGKLLVTDEKEIARLLKQVD